MCCGKNMTTEWENKSSNLKYKGKKPIMVSWGLFYSSFYIWIHFSSEDVRTPAQYHSGFVRFEKWSNFPLEIVSNVSSSLPRKSETAPKTKVSPGFITEKSIYCFLFPHRKWCFHTHILYTIQTHQLRAKNIPTVYTQNMYAFYFSILLHSILHSKLLHGGWVQNQNPFFIIYLVSSLVGFHM